MTDKPKDKKKKKKVGIKPFEFTDEILSEIEEMAGKGLTQEQIAYNIGMHPTTLSEKKYKVEKLEEAIKRGKASAIRKMSNSLFDKGTEGKDTTAMIFWLCNRAKDQWKNVNKVDDDNKNSQDELIAAIHALIGKMPG